MPCGILTPNLFTQAYLFPYIISYGRTSYRKLRCKKAYSPEEQKYVDKLIEILRSNDDTKITTTKNFLDFIKREVWNDSLKKSIQKESKIKKAHCIKFSV